MASAINYQTMVLANSLVMTTTPLHKRMEDKLQAARKQGEPPVLIEFYSACSNLISACHTTGELIKHMLDKKAGLRSKHVDVLSATSADEFDWKEYARMEVEKIPTKLIELERLAREAGTTVDARAETGQIRACIEYQYTQLMRALC